MYTVHPFWAKSKNINYKENHPQIDKTHALTRLVQTTMLEEIGQWYVQASPFRPNVFRSNIQLTKPPIVTLRPRKLGILHSRTRGFSRSLPCVHRPFWKNMQGRAQRSGCHTLPGFVACDGEQRTQVVFLALLEALNGFHFKTCVNHTRIWGHHILYLQQLQTWTLGLRNSYQLSVLCPGVVAFISSEKQD